MERIERNSVTIFCEVKQKDVSAVVERQAIYGGDSLMPIDYLYKRVICFEREQSGCSIYGEESCALRQLIGQ